MLVCVEPGSIHSAPTTYLTELSVVLRMSSTAKARAHDDARTSTRDAARPRRSWNVELICLDGTFESQPSPSHRFVWERSASALL